MDKLRVLQIFEKVLKAYSESEEMVLDERSTSYKDFENLEKEINEWREEFNEALKE